MFLFPVLPTINALAITAAITAGKKAGSANSEKPSWPEAFFLRRRMIRLLAHKDPPAGKHPSIRTDATQDREDFGCIDSINNVGIYRQLRRRTLRIDVFQEKGYTDADEGRTARPNAWIMGTPESRKMRPPIRNSRPVIAQ